MHDCQGLVKDGQKLEDVWNLPEHSGKIGTTHNLEFGLTKPKPDRSCAELKPTPVVVQLSFLLGP